MPAAVRKLYVDCRFGQLQLRIAQLVAPLLRNGRIVDLPHWGHGFLDLHTARVGRMLREFFDA
ncbi:MAG: hypothetical protein NZM12_00280 [Steroidobacteraceae bacterium]|nr:hypothetical protein [Steroidobacteraceae bacterium]MDW8258492.1 hypothetical protein [Gammaproteobacteria bacterium]